VRTAFAYEGPRIGSRGDRPRIEPEDLLPPVEVDAWVIADPDIDRHPAEPAPWFLVNMADAPEDDRDEYDPAHDYVHAGVDVGAPLAPAGAPGVPVPGADQAAAARGLANMHAANAAAAAAAQAAANANAKAPPGVLPKAGLPQQILGVDVNAIFAALLAMQGQAGAAPPPAAQPKPVPKPVAKAKAAMPEGGWRDEPETPDDDEEHVTPDDSWDAPMRQLHEMFRRHRIPPRVVDAFHRNECTTPYDVMTSGTNKEKAQANMCLSLLSSYLFVLD